VTDSRDQAASHDQAASYDQAASHDQAGAGDGTEPDPRFTFANERTFLAWSRTALALVVAGLGVVQLLPPFPGVPWGRHVLGVPLIVFGAVVAVTAYTEWTRSQRAMRHGQPLPRSVMPKLMAAVVFAMAVVSAVVVLVSALR
jgi:putative membrane protein